jgi:hypothetical protein
MIGESPGLQQPAIVPMGMKIFRSIPENTVAVTNDKTCRVFGNPAGLLSILVVPRTSGLLII